MAQASSLLVGVPFRKALKLRSLACIHSICCSSLDSPDADRWILSVLLMSLKAYCANFRILPARDKADSGSMSLNQAVTSCTITPFLFKSEASSPVCPCSTTENHSANTACQQDLFVSTLILILVDIRWPNKKLVVNAIGGRLTVERPAIAVSAILKAALRRRNKWPKLARAQPPKILLFTCKQTHFLPTFCPILTTNGAN